MLLADDFIAAPQWRAEYANPYIDIPFGAITEA
jgi:hypothetical protein